MMVPMIYSCWLILITHIKREQEHHSLRKMKQTQTGEPLSIPQLVLQKAQLVSFKLATSSYIAEIRVDQEQ